MPSVQALYVSVEPYLPYLILTFFSWFTYFYTLKKCTFVSDDFQGILDYNGKLQGFEYGMISRWIRYHLCGGDFPSGKKDANGKEIPIGKTPFRHHFLSILVLNAAVLFGYYFLSQVINPVVALMSLILLIVHPVTIQGVAWISGLGYPLCLLWIFISLSLCHWFYSTPRGIHEWIMCLVVFAFTQFMSINALFVALMLWPVLIFFGWYPFAIVSALISLMMGFHIVKITIEHRANEFRKQNMGHSTFIKPRKLIVALKTLWYYVSLIFYPVRLGLYHKFGYHYEKSIEKEDRMMFLGLSSLGLLGLLWFMVPDYTIRLSIVWFLSFIVIFLNWITIQQFVAERYSIIPALGIYLLLSVFLQNHLEFYMFIVGALICRTWLHLPTYDDELRFYQSNIWNFKDSEVAYGNLGVTYMRAGLIGSALDSWNISTKVNPNYDVPFYNIYSHYKSNGALSIQHGNYAHGLELYKTALPYLEKCLKCEVCHFREDWEKEYKEIEEMIKNPASMIEKEKIRLEKLRDELTEKKQKTEDKSNTQGIDISLNDIGARLKHIESLKNNEHPNP